MEEDNESTQYQDETFNLPHDEHILNLRIIRRVIIALLFVEYKDESEDKADIYKYHERFTKDLARDYDIDGQCKERELENDFEVFHVI